MKKLMLLFYGIMVYNFNSVGRNQKVFAWMFQKSVLLKPVNNKDLYWKTLILFLGSHNIGASFLNGLKRTVAVRCSILGLKLDINQIYPGDINSYLAVPYKACYNVSIINILTLFIAERGNADRYY